MLSATNNPMDKAAWRRLIRARRRAALAQQIAAATQSEDHPESVTMLTTHSSRNLSSPSESSSAACLARHLEEGLAKALPGRMDAPESLTLAAFSPTPTEPDLLPALRELSNRGCTLIMPVFAGKDLDWVLWDGHRPLHDSPAAAFGREPDGPRLGVDALVRVDAVIAPAVAVDRSGTRLGHGKGYYDRALRHRRHQIPILVVVHPDEVLPAGTLPRQPHDISVDFAVTSDGVYDLEPQCGAR